MKRIDWGPCMPKTFKPLCMSKRGEGYTEIAVTNRNQLLPCCHLDGPTYLKDPFIKKLAESSDISKHKSLDDIINNKEWQKLNRVLIKARDGWCKNLDKDNKKCLIYETRPHFCRVNEFSISFNGYQKSGDKFLIDCCKQHISSNYGYKSKEMKNFKKAVSKK